MVDVVQDDQYDPNAIVNENAKNADVNTGFRIEPKPNSLDSFTDYTYNISLYGLSIPQYSTLINQGADALQSILTSDNLFVRSGGSAVGTRNQFFADADFSIDDLTIKQVIDPKGNQSALATSEINLKITEPSSVTFTDRLYAAVKSIEPSPSSYYHAVYLLIIKFYGYDENGDVINPQSIDTALVDESIITRYVPFMIKSLTFKVGPRVTEYIISAANPGTVIGLSAAKNVAPVHFEFTGTTLEELFNAKNPTARVVAPDNANPGVGNSPPAVGGAETKSTVYTTGLISAINAQYEQLKARNVVEIADQIVVEFDPNSKIGQSKIVIDNNSWLEVSSMNATTNTKGLNPNTATATDARTKRRWAIDAGTSLTGFIQQAILASDYVKKQETQIIQAQNNVNNPAAGQGANVAFKWFRIIVRTEPIIPFDKKRNAYAYKTTYFVTDWRVTDVKAPSFNRNAFLGCHKKYLYSFTGENTSILKWELDFNFQYFVSYNDSQTPKVPETPANKEDVLRVPQIQNSWSKQGGEQKDVDIGAAAAGSLYSPGDLAFNRMTIIGDPGLLFNEIYDLKTIADKNAFLPDNTVNVNAGQGYYVVFFKKSNDFNTDTGVVEFDYNPAQIPNYSSLFAQAYFFVDIISKFQRGRFEQDVRGVRLDKVDPLRAIVPGDVVVSPDGSGTPTAPGSAASVTEEASQRVEYNQNAIAPNFNLRQTPTISTATDYAQVPPVPTLLSTSTLTNADDAATIVQESGQYPDFDAVSRRRLYDAFNNSGNYEDYLKPNKTQEGEVNS